MEQALASDRKLRVYAMSLGLALAVASGIIGWTFVKDRDDHLALHRQRASDSVSTLARYTAIELNVIDRAISRLVADVAAEPGLLAARDLLEEHLRRVGSGSNPAVGYGIADADGRVVAMASGIPPGTVISVADRPTFARHRDQREPGPILSDPYLSKPSGLKIFTVTRRIEDASGRFLGMAAATIQSELLFDVLAGIGRSAGTRLVIARSDGIILACVPTCVLGADISDRPAIRAVRAGQRSGVTTGVAPLEGVKVLSAFQAVDGHPLIAISATPEAQLIAEWRTDATIHMMVSGGLLALVFLGALLHYRMLRRQFAAEHGLRRSSEKLLRTSIESLRSGFAVFDGESRLQLWNRRYVEMFPYVRDVVRPGVPIRALAEAAIERRDPDLAPAKREALIARLCELPGPPGKSRRWAESRDRTIEVSDSVTADGMIVVVYHDITARERQEADLRRALHAEREMNAQQRRFVAVVSHEFRTPLTVIDGAAQLIDSLLPDGVPPTVRARTARVRKAVRQMVELIDRILGSARFAEGRVTRNDETIDIRSLVQDVCDRQGSISPDFQITVTSDGQPPMLVGDPRLIEQIVANLVSNAVKYSGRSTSVAIHIHADDAEIAIAIRDFGVGIAESEISKLFTRFYRAKTSQGIAGTGLGLHLSRDLVAMHGGRIDVSSELGKGSTFTVRLPRRTITNDQQRTAA
ncbi:MAG: PAS-domain containing protein [Alphaproteobacteria bacterium]|nr:PAS-domain containing protein [Alphaproteobacteria bacterium]